MNGPVFGGLMFVGTVAALVAVKVLRRPGITVTCPDCQDKGWWDAVERITVQRCPDRATALAVEADAIQREDPLHNIAGRLHPRTVTRLIKAGELPPDAYTKFGRSVRINRPALERWLQQRDAAA